jgi:hypothetical protein
VAVGAALLVGKRRQAVREVTVCLSNYEGDPITDSSIFYLLNLAENQATILHGCALERAFLFDNEEGRN